MPAVSGGKHSRADYLMSKFLNQLERPGPSRTVVVLAESFGALHMHEVFDADPRHISHECFGRACDY
jgi:hypothetical protein